MGSINLADKMSAAVFVFMFVGWHVRFDGALISSGFRHINLCILFVQLVEIFSWQI